MQDSTKESLVLRYNSDHFFKYMLLGDDKDDSTYIRKIMIEEGLHLNYLKTVLINPYLPSKHFKQKDMYLDSLLEDSNQRYIHLEMQRSSLDNEQKARMNVYGMNVIIDKTKSGKNYNNGITVYQCIFIDDNQVHTTMFETYKKVNEKGEEYGIGMIYTTFIYISYIEQLLLLKKKDELTNLECIIYLFRYGLDCDILKLGRKVVKIMAEKMEEYISDYGDVLHKRSVEDYARHQEWIELKIERADELEKENSTLKEESNLLKEENLSLKRAKLNDRIKSILNLMNKHEFSLSASMDILEIPEEERAELKELIEKVN